MAELDYHYIASLVEQSKMDNSDAFDELYAATFQKLYSFAWQYLKDEFLAQDALQETYILVLQNIHTLKDTRLFISWLNQIHFRVCFNMLRHQIRYERELYDQGVDISFHENEVLASGKFIDPEKWVEAKDERQYILSKVYELPYLESRVIILKYYHNIKIDEIAERMNISRSTVKRYLTTGKQKLERSLRMEKGAFRQ